MEPCSPFKNQDRFGSEAQTTFCKMLNHSEVEWALTEMQFPKDMQFLTGLGCGALICNDTYVPNSH